MFVKAEGTESAFEVNVVSRDRNVIPSEHSVNTQSTMGIARESPYVKHLGVALI